MLNTVICTGKPAQGFHIGGKYQIIEGRIIDDDGMPRPLLVKKGDTPIRTLEDIKNFKDGNWSWIGEFAEATEFRGL